MLQRQLERGKGPLSDGDAQHPAANSQWKINRLVEAEAKKQRTA